MLRKHARKHARKHGNYQNGWYRDVMELRGECNTFY